MATSEIQICSNALLLLADNTINSFDDEGDRVTLMSNLWPNARDYVLRSHPWNCAIKRVVLAPEATAPPFDWAYSFLLPGDWLRTLSIGQRGDAVPYDIEGRKIISDDNPCYLRYIFRNEDVPSYDSMLVQAMTAYIAMLAAYPITKSTSQVEAMGKLFDFHIKQARTADGQETPPEEISDTRYLSARRG